MARKTGSVTKGPNAFVNAPSRPSAGPRPFVPEPKKATPTPVGNDDNIAHVGPGHAGAFPPAGSGPPRMPDSHAGMPDRLRRK
jgi:hypothetical protein